MADDSVTITFIKRVMPWVGVVAVLDALAPEIAHWAGASNHTAAVVFLIVSVPGAVWVIVLSAALGRRLSRQRGASGRRGYQ